ncbi:MAG: hypothetical protein ACPKPY_10890 [Nitrososphaeraceae archaeon]
MRKWAKPLEDLNTRPVIIDRSPHMSFSTSSSSSSHNADSYSLSSNPREY